MSKYFTFTVLMIAVSVLLSCQSGSGKKNTGNAGITFIETEIEYGRVTFGEEGSREFLFLNSGNAPLLVTHVKSTCGCTIPKWSKKPLSPGDTGRIVVIYDTHRIGRFRKSVYVYSNAVEGTRQLHIAGEVISSQRSENH